MLLLLQSDNDPSLERMSVLDSKSTAVLKIAKTYSDDGEFGSFIVKKHSTHVWHDIWFRLATFHVAHQRIYFTAMFSRFWFARVTLSRQPPRSELER